MDNKNYVLVMKNNNNYTIGRNRYTKEDAIKRQKQTAECGLQFDVMHIDEAFGIK